MEFLPVITALKKYAEADVPAIIAIDGRCGSGKTSLAELLREQFDCNVFHMDDFFLPFEMKTEERLAEPGGNVHYERFRDEVLNGLLKQEDVAFRPYCCSKGKLGEPIHVKYKNINIVEGSYCLHPTLMHAYNYKIFLTIEPKTQQRRILKRNGERMLQNFINRWIPLEEDYFLKLNIKDHCNIIIDTTAF
ncbi:AAA family ATPase [Clostridium swellfunianum]|uniref:uridine kinase family protein n=1 Tax=Clostridium swellfunianum TaxID=1367462 RepID=UPI0020308F92|nr:AAA family ATPase [Clostridium swellfunianum]